MLLRTGQIPLVENTSVDMFWGNGEDGTGSNMLGYLLMKLRQKFIDRSL